VQPFTALFLADVRKGDAHDVVTVNDFPHAVPAYFTEFVRVNVSRHDFFSPFCSMAKAIVIGGISYQVTKTVFVVVGAYAASDVTQEVLALISINHQ
jgi:hypothetical protein